MQRGIDIRAADGLDESGCHVVVLIAVAVIAHHRPIHVIRNRGRGDLAAIVDCFRGRFKVGQAAPGITTRKHDELV